LPTSVHGNAALVEQTTPWFRHDWEELSPADRMRVRETLDRGYDLLHEDRRGFFSKAFQPLPIRLKSGLGSSLYSLRVGRDIRLVMSVDDDPVFGQTLVTLFRVVGSDDLERAYRSTAKLLYDGQLAWRNAHHHGRFTASPAHHGRCVRFQSPRP
jgi:mRNA-degrading endonuclease RelE of RelBE toxin-antitoxin system